MTFGKKLLLAPETRFPGGKELLVHFAVIEAGQRPAIQAEGPCWAGITVWQGRTAMRISVSSWATTEEDVERSLAAILRVAAS